MQGGAILIVFFRELFLIIFYIVLGNKIGTTEFIQAENISEAQFLECMNDKNKARILEENNYEIYSDLDEFIPSNSLEYLCSDVREKDYILKEINELNSIQIKNNPELIDLARHY